jgi:fatty-acid desaturase
MVKHVLNLSHVASGLLIVSAACFLEHVDRALYFIISCVAPLLMALHLALTGRMIGFSQLAIFMPLSLLYIGIPMSVCLHRYFAHRAFETSRAVQFVIGLIGCLAYQGGPLWWAMMHITHHHHCDKPGDPHSATQRGFIYAFLGWMASPLNYEVNKIEARMRLLDKSLLVPEMLLLEKFNPAPPLIVCCIASFHLGYASMCWCFLGPMLSCRLITLLFNVEFHPEENKKKCRAVNNEDIGGHHRRVPS